MALKDKLALMKALWNELQEDLFREYDGNEKMESASDDITWGLSELAMLNK